MARKKRNWHPNFIEYMNMIIRHPNYQGLRIEKKSDGSYRWIATAQSEIGKERIKWCEEKARELGIPIKAGVYADVMLAIHPTKWKVCQTCGQKMSLYYVYPNANFLNCINKTFSSSFTMCDHISDIWDVLVDEGYSELKIAEFLIDKGDLELNAESATKDDIINALEYACRKGNKKCLGPGAMSNFPDRFDGFHTYNRCCRSSQDKGRSKENLKTYTKDRRAYEYWSDGNIHAANQFMGSSFFKGISADHVGPISLGFVHDPRYLRPMIGKDNSAKRDRLQQSDIETIIGIERRTKVYPMSWYSREIWEFIRENYKKHPEKISGPYRDALKQNFANYMFILWYILSNCPLNGENILSKAFLEPNFKYFSKSYTFNELGDIIAETPRHLTERNLYEPSRYRRIAIESAIDYHTKDNRNLNPTLTKNQLKELDSICRQIESDASVLEIKDRIKNLVFEVEKTIIESL